MSVSAVTRSFISSNSRWLALGTVLVGSAFVALMSRVAIPLPFTPVPVTMQTFAIFLLAGFLGSRRAAQCVLFYMIEGTCGLPVFSGGLANPLWFIGAKAGYLVGFVVAAYIIGKLLEKRSSASYGYTLASLAVGEAVILSLGMCWLGFFVGFDKAFALGVAPFLVGGVMKITAAASLLYGTSLVKKALF